MVTTRLVLVGFPTMVPGSPPKVTEVAPKRFEPAIMTLVPPAVGPFAGATEEMMGAS